MFNEVHAFADLKKGFVSIVGRLINLLNQFRLSLIIGPIEGVKIAISCGRAPTVSCIDDIRIAGSIFRHSLKSSFEEESLWMDPIDHRDGVPCPTSKDVSAMRTFVRKVFRFFYHVNRHTERLPLLEGQQGYLIRKAGVRHKKRR
jgi:hypothetical protein